MDSGAAPSWEEMYNNSPIDTGPSLRDRIAIAALQGLLSCKPFNKNDIARSAYEYADAMLEHREL